MDSRPMTPDDYVTQGREMLNLTSSETLPLRQRLMYAYRALHLLERHESQQAYAEMLSEMPSEQSDRMYTDALIRGESR